MASWGWYAMTGNGLTDIVLPIVIAICLVTWLSMVFWANAHPTRGRYSTDLRTEVRGGSFRAMEGGRQLMPIPEHRPAVPGQRSAADSETYRVPGGATATATATADYDPSAEEDTTPMATRPRR
jgi:hypothetical protein